MFKYFLFLVCLNFCVYEFSCEDTKESIENNEYLLEKFNEWMLTEATDGIPQCNIPKADPYHFKYLNDSFPTSAAPLIEASLYDGDFGGFKNCKFTKIDMSLETATGHVTAFCTHMHIDSDYIFTSTRPLRILRGKTFHGKGHLTADFENVTLNFNMKLTAHKDEDGKIHLRFIKNLTTYNVDQTRVHPSQVLIGDVDVTDEVDSGINGRRVSKLLMQTVGRRWVLKFVPIYQELSDKFHNCHTVDEFFTDDFTPLLRN